MIYDNFYAAITDCVKYKAKMSKATKDQKEDGGEAKSDRKDETQESTTVAEVN